MLEFSALRIYRCAITPNWCNIVYVIFRVDLAKAAKKDLAKLPTHIVEKFREWVDSVEESGLEEVRKNPGWHDEPLHGTRKGQRSIRLSKAYRAIYVIKEKIEVLVVEVNKHDY